MGPARTTVAPMPMEEYCDVKTNGIAFTVGSLEDDNVTKSNGIALKKIIADEERSNEVDPWVLGAPPREGKKWSEMNGTEKLIDVATITLKLLLLLLNLYFFICSLTFLSDAFRLLGGKAAGKALSNNKILNNPISNLMMGILATVLLQMLNVRQAIFIIMGANIGTSVTNTIVSVAHAGKRDEFRRAFAAATVHDMFNWLSVICILPIEWITGAFGSWKDCGILCQVTHSMTDGLETDQKSTKKELLKAITKPFTKLVIQLDKKIIERYARNEDVGNDTLVKHFCLSTVPTAVHLGNGTCEIQDVPTTVHCDFLFEYLARSWSDDALGALLLVLSLTVLCGCLVLIVKILNSLLRGKIAVVLRKFVNADFPGIFRHLTGYVAILIGAGFTMLVQSSSVFTSALTPLVGVGILHLDRMYPLTLGANIGTTFTAILAALASDRSVFQKTLQVALAHLFFNIFGILIWYPVPVMRRVPVALAKILGNTTAEYRWFAFLYLFVLFLIIPGLVFGLSVAGTSVLAGVGLPIFVSLVIIAIINVLQNKRPKCLPAKIRSWDFLPLPMHSFEPYDKFFSKLCSVCKCCVSENDD